MVQNTNNSSCLLGHELFGTEYTTNDKGELVYVCQRCHAEIPSEQVGDSVE